MGGLAATPGSASLAFSSSKAGPVLVQVYSHTSVPVSFQIELATSPAETGAGEP